VAIASGKHPVSIPNLEVKPDSADGTATGRSWESRTPPDIHTVKGHPTGVALNIYPGEPTHGPSDPHGFRLARADVLVSPRGGSPSRGGRAEAPARCDEHLVWAACSVAGVFRLQLTWALGKGVDSGTFVRAAAPRVPGDGGSGRRFLAAPAPVRSTGTTSR
jgi:hypothetical protein